MCAQAARDIIYGVQTTDDEVQSSSSRRSTRFFGGRWLWQIDRSDRLPFLLFYVTASIKSQGESFLSHHITIKGAAAAAAAAAASGGPRQRAKINLGRVNRFDRILISSLESECGLFTFFCPPSD